MEGIGCDQQQKRQHFVKTYLNFGSSLRALIQ